MSNPSPNVYGTRGNDVVHGSDEADAIFPYTGSDLIFANGGPDIVYGSWGNDTIVGGGGVDTIWGGFDYDTVQYNTSPGFVMVDLSASLTFYDGFGSSDYIYEVENVFGSSHNDHVWGNAGTNVLSGWHGSDNLAGRDGNDVLVGGAGIDFLWGGAGADKFKYDFASDRGDTVYDYNQLEGDKIDLSGMDASAALGDQDFSFIGYNRPFTGAAQLTYHYDAEGNTHIVGSIDNDIYGDFHIRIIGAKSITAADFIGLASNVIVMDPVFG
jgi:Ca2+-binding RTX toxin-like protein